MEEIILKSGKSGRLMWAIVFGKFPPLVLTS
jgi:hypothetical protein